MTMSAIKESLKNDKELFSAPIIKFDSNAADGGAANAPAVYQKVINDAKKYMNKAGALYIASEVMPFDLPSENFKRVKYDAEAKKFLKTFTSPQPIPVIYNHNDGTDPWVVMDDKPDVAGRVLSATIAEGIFKVPSVFAGQMIVNKESIERIQDMVDYTQSISYMPKGYICEECGIDGTSDDCPHYPGQVIKDKNGKERRVIFTSIPNYAAELSFVLVPGYRNARVVAMEQNSAGAPITGLKAITFYNKKIQEVVNFDKGQSLETAEGSSGTEDNTKLDDWRQKYKVPEEGETYNNKTTSIIEKIKDNPDRDAKWNAPSSQTARFEALEGANAKSWREGFLKVEDGQLKYPFIDSSGKAMLSGVKAAKQRAVSQGDTKLVEICDKITKEFEEEENNSSQNVDKQNTCDTIDQEFVIQEGPDMEKLLEVLNSLSAQMADQNKMFGEFVSSFKVTNTNTTTQTETAQTDTETNSATAGSGTETNSTQESNKDLIAIVKTLVEQNKAILEKLEANKQTSETGTTPETEEGAQGSAATQSETNSATETATTTETVTTATQAEANNGSQDGASKTKKVVVTGLAKTLNGQL